MSKETLMNERLERGAEQAFKKFRPQMESFVNDSPLSKVRTLSPYDVFALGQMLQQFQGYVEFVNESNPGVAKDLGHLPDIALDVITASYGASIIPVLCSTQPIDEERGTIYFKNTKAMVTRGNVTSGQMLREGALPPDVYPQGFAGAYVSAEALGNSVSGTASYSGTLAKYPVRANTIKVTWGTVTLKDDGDGHLVGPHGEGTIDYDSGAYVATFNPAPAAATAIKGYYETDFENAATLPKVNFEMTSTSIDAEIFVLASDLGLFKAYSMKKRFGMAAEDEMMADLTNEIQAELGNTAINRLVAACSGTVDWNRIPSSGLSWFEHKQELKDVIARSEATIVANAGRGVVNTIIAGVNATSFLSNLPGYVKTGIAGIGPTVHGSLDGMPVIRAPTVTTNKMYTVYKGQGAFDTPIVYAPYMPLFVTSTLPVPTNSLQRRGLAALWAGLKVVAGEFCTEIAITES